MQLRMKKFKEILLIFVFFDEFVNFFENFKIRKVQTLWSLTFQFFTSFFIFNFKKKFFIFWESYYKKHKHISCHDFILETEQVKKGESFRLDTSSSGWYRVLIFISICWLLFWRFNKNVFSPCKFTHKWRESLMT